MALMVIFASGCKTIDPIIVYKTETLYQDKYVPIADGLVAPVEVVELSEDFDLPELGAGFKACIVRVKQCNGKLSEIGSIGKDTDGN